MDKNINPKRVRTAPLTLASMECEAEIERNQRKAALLRELGGYEVRLQEARSPLFAKRRKAREKCDAAAKAGKVDLPAAVSGAFTEIVTDGELGDVYRWRYTVRKLKACVGVLDPERDAELAGLRKFMRSFKET